MKPAAKAVIFALVVGVVWWWAIPRLRYTPTSSAGAHFFRVKRCAYERHETVEVRVSPDDPFVPDPAYHLLIKHIACMPGDTIEKRGLTYYCNGFVVATAKLRAKDGRSLTPWIPESNAIPPDRYFLATFSKDSYDSRYLGLFGKKDIVNCLCPIF